jgi:hypothetical protein
MFFARLVNDDRPGAANFRDGIVDFDIRTAQNDGHKRQRMVMMTHRAAAAMPGLEDAHSPGNDLHGGPLLRPGTPVILRSAPELVEGPRLEGPYDPVRRRW